MGKTSNAIDAIPSGYRYGQEYKLSAPDTKDGRKNVRAIARVDRALHLFSVCTECDSSTSWNYSMLQNVVIHSGSDDDILGVGNRETFREEYGDTVGATFHAYAYGYAFCVNPDLIDHDELSEILERMESFADYPVFDDSDYSQRGAEEWATNLADEISYANVPEESASVVAEWLSENYYGYSDPGYVSPDWLAEAMTELGITPSDD